MSDHIKLPDNYLRSVSAAIYLVEKNLDEFEQMLISEKNHTTYKIVNDIGADKTQHLLDVISQSRQIISNLQEKYNLKREETYLSRILAAYKSRAWEMLSDTKSKRMKGYGELQHEQAVILDKDIENLLKVISKL